MTKIQTVKLLRHCEPTGTWNSFHIGNRRCSRIRAVMRRRRSERSSTETIIWSWMRLHFVTFVINFFNCLPDIGTQEMILLHECCRDWRNIYTAHYTPHVFIMTSKIWLDKKGVTDRETIGRNELHWYWNSKKWQAVYTCCAVQLFCGSRGSSTAQEAWSSWTPFQGICKSEFR